MSEMGMYEELLCREPNYLRAVVRMMRADDDDALRVCIEEVNQAAALVSRVLDRLKEMRVND